jgi:uncharacterized protein
MFIALRDLATQPVVVSESLKPGVVDLRSPDCRQVGPLTVDAIVSLVSEEIRVQGRLEVEVEAECSRCLELVRIPVKKDFDLFYRSSKTLTPTKRDEEIELKPQELDVGFFVGTGLELNDTLREQILIEVPMQPMCQPRCRGLCPECGANLNVAPCGCAGKPVDPRWVKLEELRKS